MEFELLKTSENSRARAGNITTDHGKIETPIFMPVGTAGSVKGIHTRDLHEDINAQIILGNTYHLYLRPGIDVIEKAGGLHKFNRWNGPILTDSGGYQVFSLGDIRKLGEDGARFQSHIDGSYHMFTPENVMDIQRSIGADIIMAFDECSPGDADYNYAKNSLELTQRWLERCFVQFNKTEPKYDHRQSLFPIVQGNTFEDLRKIAVAHVKNFDADGYAIGGLSVGEAEEIMYEMTEVCTADLPTDKPRYLMGVGTPVNILESIERGIDMFDCVMPTRNGRNGMLFTSKGIINIKNKKWENDHSVIDEDEHSFVDQYSKSYLRHLIISNEMLGAQIASQHNLAFYLWLVKTARQKIIDGNFESWKREMVVKLKERL
ncbi:tRNA guanosine(34) transglycosylase Tgt [Maribellus comscasis]|uniref:Queuine tRNA-ribosyltransferase n=1 Tax=Maribellus comscasis TaxID=2681766 RepID=A0A6I6JRT3_9BACT|nr:tRNA guanosine(34) transglycosylase Tgt [Maribellus comscasis]QGY45141.1 tRNA guanosine(34) transglycosylase Tgt [Maribellus comscasis]